MMRAKPAQKPARKPGRATSRSGSPAETTTEAVTPPVATSPSRRAAVMMPVAHPVPPADAVALENAIARLAASEELRERLGRAAQESMKRHEWPRAALELEALFLRVVRAGEASRRA